MRTTDEVTSRMRRPDFDRWLHQAAQTGYCSQPVRLVGSSTTVDARTGEVLGHYASQHEPDGVTYVRCGNRRAVRCAGCSHEYKADMWHLVVAGAAGASKGVPASVATHPLVFTTLTAPSFGAVHSTAKPGGRARPCRPRKRHARCPHGRPTWCSSTHAATDRIAGEPLCADCYDYRGHVAWQWHAPELWRRFVIRLRRELAVTIGVSEKDCRGLVRVQFAKVAEFQRRGVVHLHALIRLDGNGTADDPFPPPAVTIAPALLEQLILRAAQHVEVVAPPLPGETEPRLLRWGKQCDARTVRRHVNTENGELTDRAVAAYIAKYATKATEDVDGGDSPAGPRPHLRRIRELIRELGTAVTDADDTYALMRRWVHMLGFRGHFSTKSRRYSTTLGALRAARRTWRRARMQPLHGSSFQQAPVDDDSTLVVGEWSFIGMGWLTEGDAALAREAATAAREWRDAYRAATRTDNER